MLISHIWQHRLKKNFITAEILSDSAGIGYSVGPTKEPKGILFHSDFFPIGNRAFYFSILLVLLNTLKELFISCTYTIP